MSTITKPRTKAAALARLQALIAGTQKHAPAGTFTLANVPYTPASILAFLEGVAGTITALNAAQAGVKDLLAKTRGAQTSAEPIVQAYEELVLAMFIGSEQTLADFGVDAPRKPAPRTSEQLAAAAKKAEATRIARGTTSRKRKLAIRGNVTGIVVTPVITATTAPQPVSSAPSATTPGRST